MNRAEQAQAINAALSDRWVSLIDDRQKRAQAVIDWCQSHEIDTASILAQPLAEAMKHQPDWFQGPGDYLDMVYSIAAFLAART